MKKCQFCAEEIQDEAKLCKHCGKGQKKAFDRPRLLLFTFIGLFILIAIFNSSEKTSEQLTPTRTSEPTLQIKLEIVKGWEWVTKGDYTYVRGSVKNIGDVPIDYFEVLAKYKNKKGEVIDSDYTNSGERINPGEAKKFEIMHRDSAEFEKVGLSIGKVSRAR